MRPSLYKVKNAVPVKPCRSETRLNGTATFTAGARRPAHDWTCPTILSYPSLTAWRLQLLAPAVRTPRDPLPPHSEAWAYSSLLRVSETAAGHSCSAAAPCPARWCVWCFLTLCRVPQILFIQWTAHWHPTAPIPCVSRPSPHSKTT